MSRSQQTVHENHESFVCGNCRSVVPPVTLGGKNRNHCHRCLHSRHVDIVAGDRRSPCRGLMQPIAIWVKPDGEWSILHRCSRCGIIRANRIAADDDEDVLLRLSLRAVTRLPFPLEA